MLIVRRAVLAALACAACLTAPAFAQTYPNKPIHLIVPYPAGGGTDFFARLVGQKMSELIGQPIVVENKPGAATNLGADFVAKAAPCRRAKRGAAETPEAARRHSPIPVRPLNAGCDSGPLIVGAGEGDASGAGIRLPTGASGVGGAKRVVARA